MKKSVTITGENLNVVVNDVVETTSTPVSASHVMSKAEKRIALLRRSGVDTSCYFPLGTDQVIKIKDGCAIPVDMTDDVESQLVDGGFINHYTLFRRWVMAQTFAMLRKMETDDTNFSSLIQEKGYEYQWKMLERELYAQTKMLEHDDYDNLQARFRWFKGSVVANMCEDYICKLQKYIEDTLVYRQKGWYKKVYKHTCKGNPYIRFCGENIFVSDIESKVYGPLRVFKQMFRDYANVSSVEKLYRSVVLFNKTRKKLPWATKQSDAFINAYKGSGAYFTMRNLIMFHGARFVEDGEKLSQELSLKQVERYAVEYKKDGWKMLGVLKELIQVSGISIDKKIDEWRLK